MESKVEYFIVDKNNNFITFDSEYDCMLGDNYIDDDCISYDELIRAKNRCYNLEQEWIVGDIGKHNVEFPLRPIKVTTTRKFEEVKLP